MEKRRFGRSGHQSTVAIFGAAAFWDIPQDEADQVLDLLIDAGVNHIDIAPSYGMAEQRVGPWMPEHRARFFLGCKTMERQREGAWKEMHESLERLHTDHFDLYQLHAVTKMEELDQLTAPGGALEAVIEARDQGLTSYIGITGHDMQAPQIYLEALRRFDFDSVLFPVNFIHFADPDYRAAALELIETCRQKDVGIMAIKSVAKLPWKDRPKTHTTWYEPFTDMENIQQAVNFSLSHGVTGICTVGDTTVLPLVLQACQNFTPLSEEEQQALIQRSTQFENIYT